jgi:hypothetical protein
MHVLTGDGDRRWTIVMHIPVPGPPAVNSVGVNWREAVLNSGLGGTTSLPDGDGTVGTISAAEKALVNAGELYEYRATTEIDGQGTDNISRQALLRALYADTSAKVLADLQRRLKFYGYTLEES